MMLNVRASFRMLRLVLSPGTRDFFRMSRFFFGDHPFLNFSKRLILPGERFALFLLIVVISIELIYCLLGC